MPIIDKFISQLHHGALDLQFFIDVPTRFCLVWHFRHVGRITWNIRDTTPIHLRQLMAVSGQRNGTRASSKMHIHVAFFNQTTWRLKIRETSTVRPRKGGRFNPIEPPRSTSDDHVSPSATCTWPTMSSQDVTSSQDGQIVAEEGQMRRKVVRGCRAVGVGFSGESWILLSHGVKWWDGMAKSSRQCSGPQMMMCKIGIMRSGVHEVRARCLFCIEYHNFSKYEYFQ